MSEENDDKATTAIKKVLESCDTSMNVVPPAEEAIGNSSYQSKLESDIVDKEGMDNLDEGANDAAIKEVYEDAGGSGDIVEPVLVEKSPAEETGSASGQPRKSPALVIVGQNHKFNVRSRYLSNSISSCHDLCKYGHKHDSEKKTRRLSLGAMREAQPLMKTASNSLEKSVAEKANKKKDLNRRLSLPGPLPEKSPPMRVEEKSLPKNDLNRSKMMRIPSEIKPPNPGNSSRVKTDKQAVKKTASQSSNFLEKTAQKDREFKTQKEAAQKDKELKTEKEAAQKDKEFKTEKEESSFIQGDKEIEATESSSPEASVKKEAGNSKRIRGGIKAKEPMSNSPKTPLKKSPSLKAKLYKSRRSSSRSEIQFNPEEAKGDGHDDIPVKTLYMIEPNSSTKPAKKTPINSLRNGNLRSTQATRASKTQGSNDGKRRGSGVSQLSSSSQESSQPRGVVQQGSESTKKTVVSKIKQIGSKIEDGEPKTGLARVKSAVTHRMKSLDFKNTKQIDSMREDGRSKSNTPRAKSTLEPKAKPKRKEKSQPEEKDDSAWKVKFKRGTVVALQVANNAPKKLRFKKRTLDEDNTAKAEGHRKLRSDNITANEPNVGEPGPEKVRLRHQEASEKKDDVDLNNVIEETASKLVKTRKSKVKALVGAFETVMSLRDHKRLVDTNAS